jgi:SAM-dependent methyltransferase
MPNWDEKYGATPAGLFGPGPNEYLREVVARSDFAARTALFLADGDGRNSRWLAKQGLAVAAVDISAVATRNAQALDADAAVTVTRSVADIETWLPPAGRRYDAVFIFYLQGPAALRSCALRLGWRALAPGGWIVVEGFAKGQTREAVGPPSPDHRYGLDEIAGALPGHSVVEALAGRVRLNEGARHRGEAEVVRFVGCKP